MEAGFVELSGPRRSLGIKGNTTDNNNCVLRKLDKDTAETAPSDPHQSRRDPPTQLSRNVGGQDLPARLCGRLELFVVFNWIVACLSTDCTYLHFALRSSRTYTYLVANAERTVMPQNIVTRTVSFVLRDIFYVMAFKTDLT